MSLDHYASTNLARSVRQVIHALRSDPAKVAGHVAVRAKRLHRDEERMSLALGRPLNNLDVLVVGPGPYLVEPRFYGVKNRVTAVDLDVIPYGFSPTPYWQMLRRNGFGRFAKTVGRKILGVDRRQANAWKQELRINRLPDLKLLQGDILNGPPAAAAFDVAACWAVFQHLPDPAAAVRHMADSLRPGGVLFIAIHLYTSHTGHHDIRAFTGGSGQLPAFAHLRASTQESVESSAWLNRWRLRDWRAMLDDVAPGYVEYRECYDEAGTRAMLSSGVRAELADYSDEELFTVDVFYVWRKPG